MYYCINTYSRCRNDEKKAGFAFKVNSEITALFTQYGKLKAYNDGSEIVKQGGDYSNFVYIVLEGEADVIRIDRFGNENVLASVGVGDIVGEMGGLFSVINDQLPSEPSPLLRHLNVQTRCLFAVFSPHMNSHIVL